MPSDQSAEIGLGQSHSDGQLSYRHVLVIDSDTQAAFRFVMALVHANSKQGNLDAFATNPEHDITSMSYINPPDMLDDVIFQVALALNHPVKDGRLETAGNLRDDTIETYFGEETITEDQGAKVPDFGLPIETEITGPLCRVLFEAGPRTLAASAANWLIRRLRPATSRKLLPVSGQNMTPAERLRVVFHPFGTRSDPEGATRLERAFNGVQFGGKTVVPDSAIVLLSAITPFTDITTTLSNAIRNIDGNDRPLVFAFGQALDLISMQDIAIDHRDMRKRHDTAAHWQIHEFAQESFVSHAEPVTSQQVPEDSKHYIDALLDEVSDFSNYQLADAHSAYGTMGFSLRLVPFSIDGFISSTETAGVYPHGDRFHRPIHRFQSIIGSDEAKALHAMKIGSDPSTMSIEDYYRTVMRIWAPFNLRPALTAALLPKGQHYQDE